MTYQEKIQAVMKVLGKWDDDVLDHDRWAEDILKSIGITPENSASAVKKKDWKDNPLWVEKSPEFDGDSAIPSDFGP